MYSFEAEIVTLIEKVMMQLPPDNLGSHGDYLAGYIECLHDTGQISMSVRDSLYATYAK